MNYVAVLDYQLDDEQYFIGVTYYHYQRADKGADNSWDYDGYVEYDFDILNENETPIVGLRESLDDSEINNICRVIEDYFDAPNHSDY